MIPLITALADARKAAGIHQKHIAAGLGLGAKAGESMVSVWEHGRSVPTVGHACGYAALVGRRIVAVRDGEVVGELGELMPRLGELLDEAGLSMRQVAKGLFMSPTTVRSIVLLAGPRTRLTSAQSLLGAVRCTLDLAPEVTA